MFSFLLSTTADNYVHDQFFSPILPPSLSWSFSFSFCQSLFHPELMNSTYRALKGSTSRIHYQNSPIHLHLLLHICFHSHRLPLTLSSHVYTFFSLLFFLTSICCSHCFTFSHHKMTIICIFSH